MPANTISAGCDLDGRVCLWLATSQGEVQLTNENWSQITKQFGYPVGELVSVTLNTKIAGPGEKNK